MSHVQIADDAEQLRAARINDGGADVVLAADLVTAAGREGLRRMSSARSHAIVDTDAAVVSAFTRNGDLDFGSAAMVGAIAATIGRERVHCLPANALATHHLGDAIGANLMLVGYAYQMGLIPMSAAALERAIAINDVKVDFNIRAFHLGRLLAHDPTRVAGAAAEGAVPASSLADTIARREAWLVDYQDAAYGARYRALVERVAAVEQAQSSAAQDLARTVAESYFHLLAYKDEYEVARLLSHKDFLSKLHQQFQGNFKLRFHLAPPLLAKRDAHSGREIKHEYGVWALWLFRLLASLKGIRGTVLDPFGYLRERRVERALIKEYEALADEVCEALNHDNHRAAIELLALARKVRGYGVVKQRSVETYRKTLASLRMSWRAPRTDRAAGF